MRKDTKGLSTRDKRFVRQASQRKRDLERFKYRHPINSRVTHWNARFQRHLSKINALQAPSLH